jgi:hypothetical protein
MLVSAFLYMSVSSTKILAYGNGRISRIKQNLYHHKIINIYKKKLSPFILVTKYIQIINSLLIINQQLIFAF